MDVKLAFSVTRCFFFKSFGALLVSICVLHYDRFVLADVSALFHHMFISFVPSIDYILACKVTGHPHCDEKTEHNDDSGAEFLDMVLPEPVLSISRLYIFISIIYLLV